MRGILARLGDASDLVHRVARGLAPQYARRLLDSLAENHIVLLDALREAVSTGDAHEVVRVWEDHVLSGMTVPGILGPL